MELAPHVRPLEDDEVDRTKVYAQQCVQLIVTNRSRAYPNGICSVTKCKSFVR